MIAIEDMRMINMAKNNYPDLYNKIKKDRAIHGWVDSYFNIDSILGWTDNLFESGDTEWGKNKCIWDMFKERAPKYWEYSIQLRIYFAVTIILASLSCILSFLVC